MKKNLLLLLALVVTFLNSSFAQVAPGFDIFTLPSRFDVQSESYFKNNGFVATGLEVQTHGSIYSSDKYNYDPVIVKRYLDKYFPGSDNTGMVLLDWEVGPYYEVRDYPVTDSRFKRGESEFIDLINEVRRLRPKMKLGYYSIPFRGVNDWQMDNYNTPGKLDKIISNVDFIVPSTYIQYTDEERGHQWNVDYIKRNLTPALILGKKHGKPVYPAFWHRVHYNNKAHGHEILQKEVLAKYVKVIKDFSYNGYKSAGAFWWDDVSGRLNDLGGINGHLNGTVYDATTYDAMIVNYGKYIKQELNAITVSEPAPSEHVPSPEAQQVVSYTLFNADTKKEIQTLENGATLDLSALPTRNLNIRANTNPATVGSVVFALSGAQSKSVTESAAPYDIMGDNGAWSPAIGSYTLKGTPYTGSKATGTAGMALSISITVVERVPEPAPEPEPVPSPVVQQVVSYTLFNATTKQEIQTLANGATLDMATLMTKSFNIRANTNSTVGSVVLSLSGTQNKSVTETIAPYDLMGDNGTWTPTVGNYTLEATPYTGAKATGEAGTVYSIGFTVVNSTSSTGPNGESFTLINADTEKDIMTVSDNTNLNLATLPTKNLNIRFNNGTVQTSSVKLVLSGTQSKTIIEGMAPYALFADDMKGNYYSWTPATGSYTLKATPYSGSKATGTAGTTYSINFTVSNSLSAASSSSLSIDSTSMSFDATSNVVAHPNPASTLLNVEANEAGEGASTINMYDYNGKLVLAQEAQATAGGLKAVVDISKLRQGLYILEVVTPRGRTSQRVIKK